MDRRTKSYPCLCITDCITGSSFDIARCIGDYPGQLVSYEDIGPSTNRMLSTICATPCSSECLPK